jgi:muconolactone delta-isomerase
MLFHITMTHLAKDCPAYNHDDMPDMVEGLKKLEEQAKDLSVKIHFIVWAAPEHTAYALLEADRLGNLAQFLNAIPIRQDFRVTPVENVQQMVETTGAILTRSKRS